MRAPGRSGLNRTTWDLRYDGPHQVELRTTPPDNPRIWDEPRFKGKPTRPIVHWGIESPQRAGPLVLPGRYNVRVTADGKSAIQALTVLRDPGISTEAADLAASTSTQLRIRDDLNATAELVNRIEVLRKQIEDRGAGENDRALDQQLLAVELRLVSRTELHSDDKWYVEPYGVYLNLVWLSGEVGSGAGDVAGGAEFRPTDASLATLAQLERQLAEAKAAFGKLPPIAERQP
jgi:hypothetical protein